MCIDMRFLKALLLLLVVAASSLFVGVQFSHAAALPVLNTFNLTGYTVGNFMLQSDGKILIGAYNSFVNQVQRFNADGSLDTGFGTGGQVSNGIYTIRIMPDGKILIGGRFMSNFMQNVNCIVRLNTDGTLDT